MQPQIRLAVERGFEEQEKGLFLLSLSLARHGDKQRQGEEV